MLLDSLHELPRHVVGMMDTVTAFPTDDAQVGRTREAYRTAGRRRRNVGYPNAAALGAVGNAIVARNHRQEAAFE